MVMKMLVSCLGNLANHWVMYIFISLLCSCGWRAARVEETLGH
jgi:hypothetical protein